MSRYGREFERGDFLSRFLSTSSNDFAIPNDAELGRELGSFVLAGIIEMFLSHK